MIINLNKRLFFIIIIIVLPNFVKAQEQSTYFTFGNERMDRGKLVYPQNSNSVMIAGETENLNSLNKLLFLTSVTTEGNVNWYKTYGGNISYAVNDWSITNDGGFILSAEQYYLNDRETLYLMKLDNEGNVQWTKLFDEGGNEVEGLSIAQTKDEGYIVTGLIKLRSTVSDVFFAMKQEEQYMYILKTDKNGNKEWSKKFNYDAGSLATGSKVLETENGYLIGGVIGIVAGEKEEEKSSDMLLLQINFKGDFLWAKRIGGNKNENIKNMLFIDNDLFVIGATTSFGEGKADAYLARLTVKGEVKWFKTYGGTGHENMTSILKANENELLIAGETQSFGNGIYDALIIATDKNGEITASETFGQDKHVEMGAVAIKDNKIFITGFSFTSTTQKSTQAYLLSYNFNDKNKKCFFKTAQIIAKNHTSGIAIKELNKQMLTNVVPLAEKSALPVYSTVVQNKIIITETFCK
ncbi:MAG: hypothetical protein V4547_16045 [Bacteroidota bacterium]